jgi:hypothetical protein
MIIGKEHKISYRLTKYYWMTTRNILQVEKYDYWITTGISLHITQYDYWMRTRNILQINEILLDDSAKYLTDREV